MDNYLQINDMDNYLNSEKLQKLRISIIFNKGDTELSKPFFLFSFFLVNIKFIIEIDAPT